LNLGGSENLVSNGGRPPSDGEGGWSHTASESIGAPSVGGSSGGSDDDDRPAGGQGTRSRGRDSGFGHMLDAPDRMTITQNGPKLVIKTNGPNGDSSEEYTAGEKTTVSSGRGDADRTSGWRGPAFVVSTKAKKGPSKEDAYALDSEGHLIVTTQLSGGRMGKLDIKRVYGRVKPQHR
jgi:hypothetical protein